MFEELGMLPVPSALDLADFKREIGALYMLKEQAFVAGDPDPIVTRFYAEDATTVGPRGIVVQGRDALRAMYVDMVKNKTVEIVPWQTFVCGAAGWDWTRFHVRPNDPAKPASTYIILFIWTRDEGRWTCAGDMILAEEPPAAQA